VGFSLTPQLQGAKLRIRDLSTNFCMDSYSILDNGPSQAVPKTALPNLVPSDVVPADIAPTNPLSSNPVGSKSKMETKAAAAAREALRFPGEDGGKSLSEMAQRDLDATLQLLAERAQYITGASGAAIALRQGDTMVCCASSGASAPELGAHLQIDSGLSAESVKTRQTLQCDDAENDPRVNRESCRAFGIASVVVMPLVRGDEVYGVFELLSGRPRAFEERDFVALNRLAEMIQTAVEHSDAAKRAETELAQPEIAAAAAAEPGPAVTPELRTDIVAGDSDKRTAEPEKALAMAAGAGTADSHAAPEVGSSSTLLETPAAIAHIDENLTGSDLATPISTIAFGNLRRCETCGFPVSEGRRLCLDCEAATPGGIASVDLPGIFGEESRPGWVRSHIYLIATAVIAAATIALLLWRF
jgi:putative methionine-R-sulfoxide reductase with GAF domain